MPNATAAADIASAVTEAITTPIPVTGHSRVANIIGNIVYLVTVL